MDGTQPGNFAQITTFGSAWSSQTLASMYIEGGDKLAADIGSNTCKTTNAVLSLNTWHHVAIVKKGTGQMDIADYDLYVDGVSIADKTSSGVGTQNMGTITGFSVGTAFNGSNDPLKGMVSNPKVWNVALTADDITKEYALGRTGKSLNITDTSVCIGGTAPTAQLDVRGVVEVSGGIRGTDTTALTLHGCPMVTVSLGPTASSTLTQFDTEAYKGIWLAVLHRTVDRHGDVGLTTSAIIHKTNGISITTLHSSGYIAITNDSNSIKIGSGSAVSKNNLPGTYDFELKMVRLLQ